MRRPRLAPLPGPSIDGQVVTSRPRRWPSSSERELTRRATQQQRAWRAEHIAKHGPHTCTPDPTDPWSACHLEPTKEDSR